MPLKAFGVASAAVLQDSGIDKELMEVRANRRTQLGVPSKGTASVGFVGTWNGKKRESICFNQKDHRRKELVIDIPKTVEPVFKELVQNIVELVFWPQCCIYKVPKNLYKLNTEVYTPQLISIGPLHHGNEQLAKMEKQKSIYLSEFFKRTNCKATWEDFVSILEKEDEERIRRCYAEKSGLCSNEYVKMILLDAVFIIEHFIRVVIEKKKHEDYYMLKIPWLENGIRLDLLLLENQLPYSVLNALFKSAFPDNKPCELMEGRLDFHELTCLYFLNIYRTLDMIPDEKEVLHFTDLLRYFLSHRRPKTQNSSIAKNLCSATKLHEAGLEFKGIEDQCITNMEFEKGELLRCKGGKLLMPQFAVSDSTECVVRNLMALEQCHYPSETYICNYIILMDFLINTAKDVDLLVEKGVIVNWLGSSEAVAELANKLCLNIVVSKFCYHDICEELNVHYKNPYHRTMKTLKRVYFANIWRGTSTVAAVILLMIPVLQTINSFRQLS